MVIGKHKKTPKHKPQTLDNSNDSQIWSNGYVTAASKLRKLKEW